MSQTNVTEKIAEIIRDALESPDLAVTATTTANDVEGWDSFKQIEILIALEQTFGMKFSSAEMDNLKNVGDLIATVSRKLPA